MSGAGALGLRAGAVDEELLLWALAPAQTTHPAATSKKEESLTWKRIIFRLLDLTDHQQLKAEQ
jgi:hypothetical protein